VGARDPEVEALERGKTLQRKERTMKRHSGARSQDQKAHSHRSALGESSNRKRKTWTGWLPSDQNKKARITTTSQTGKGDKSEKIIQKKV